MVYSFQKVGEMRWVSTLENCVVHRVSTKPHGNSCHASPENLGRHLVWAQMSVEDLEEECRQHDLHWSAPPVGRPPMQSVSMVHANSSHKKEMLRLGKKVATRYNSLVQGLKRWSFLVSLLLYYVHGGYIFIIFEGI